jgi:hypothetical protein
MKKFLLFSVPLILFASCSLLDLFMPDGNDDPDYYDQL